MGKWHLEVFKMALYIAFPVGLFHYFNQPSFYKDWVEKSIEELYKPETPAVAEFRQSLKNFKKEQERKEQAKLEKEVLG